MVSLAPTAADRPDALPTDRLFASGRARPGIAPGLRDVPDRRNLFAVVSVWFQITGGWVVAGQLRHPLVGIAVVLWVGRCISLIFLLNHESVHALLFSRRRFNDAVGRYLLAAPVFLSYEGYRDAHLAHHKDELGPGEPDMGLYAGYPTTWARFANRVRRDALGRSGSKQLRLLLGGRRSLIARVAAANVLVALAAWAATGAWWAWLIVWLLPWATVWQVINRLRAIAEHAGLEPGDDRRLNCHVVRQTWLPGQVLVPFKSGYHLAHHVDTSIPWTKLETLNTELVDAGWITSTITHRSYRALWRYLVTGARPTATAS